MSTTGLATAVCCIHAGYRTRLREFTHSDLICRSVVRLLAGLLGSLLLHLAGDMHVRRRVHKQRFVARLEEASRTLPRFSRVLKRPTICHESARIAMTTAF